MVCGRVASPVPWLIQSLTMNWIQVAASRFSEVAGRKVFRVISRRLTSRGLGVRSVSVSGWAWTGLTLRPNRRPAAPIIGWSRSL